MTEDTRIETGPLIRLDMSPEDAARFTGGWAYDVPLRSEPPDTPQSGRWLGWVMPLGLLFTAGLVLWAVL